MHIETESRKLKALKLKIIRTSQLIFDVSCNIKSPLGKTSLDWLKKLNVSFHWLLSKIDFVTTYIFCGWTQCSSTSAQCSRVIQEWIFRSWDLKWGMVISQWNYKGVMDVPSEFFTKCTPSFISHFSSVNLSFILNLLLIPLNMKVHLKAGDLP